MRTDASRRAGAARVGATGKAAAAVRSEIAFSPVSSWDSNPCTSPAKASASEGQAPGSSCTSSVTRSNPRRTRSPAYWSGRPCRSRTSFTKPSMRCTRRDTSTKPVRLASPFRVWPSRKKPAGSTPLVSKSIHAKLRRPMRSPATWRNISSRFRRRASSMIATTSPVASTGGCARRQPRLIDNRNR